MSGLRLLALLFFATTTIPRLAAQANATANQRFQLSAFAGASAVQTGINSGRNLSFTAGVDLELRHYFHLNPALEVRGTLPVSDGSVDNQRNGLVGLTFSGHLGRLHPYGDFLFGRGQINYAPPLPDPQGVFRYVQSTSYVLSPGGGARLDLDEHFALRADAQFQRYDTPVTASGHLFATAITGAVVYRFDFNHHMP